MIRDEMINKPVGLVKTAADGAQAVSLSVMPDFLSVKERAAIVEKSKATNNGIDTDSELHYNVQP